MNTTPEQLRLAADILEKDIPYEFYSNLSDQWVGGVFGPLHYLTTGNQIRLRPLSFPPIPEGTEWHNPEEVPAEKFDFSSWRPMVNGEADGRHAKIADVWIPSSGEFQTGTGANKNCWTYRVPISTPFPDGSFVKDGVLVKLWSLTRHIPGFRPLRDGEEWMAHQEWEEGMLSASERPLLYGEKIEVGDLGINSTTGKFVPIAFAIGKTTEYLAKTTRPLPEPPKLVPLGPSDVPPGSAIRDKSEPTIWRAITAVDSTRVFQSNSVRPSITFQELLDEEKEILRPGKTDWQSCSKTA